MNDRGHILIVDDEPEMARLIEDDLRRRGFSAVTASDAERALDLVEGEPFETVLTDIQMPGISGVELCERILERDSRLPVVVMTAYGSTESAIAALRAQAFDFVTKPFEMELLALTLDRAVRHARLTDRVRVLTNPSLPEEGLEDLVGSSPAMRRLRRDLTRVAASSETVLITGESGTGKEVVARTICRLGPRKERPFVAVNCAALPAQLLEAELFGHLKGAFTDADQERKGLFQAAHGGTLFLDEIGEAPLETQPKLLRAIETGHVRPVGSDHEVRTDLRILCATNRDLATAIAEGSFREDLYYRIRVLDLHLPPLHERGADVLEIAAAFLAKRARDGADPTQLSDDVARRFLDYPWPGNVRELENTLSRALALSQDATLQIADLPDSLRDHRPSSQRRAPQGMADLVPLETLERGYILEVLRLVGNNKARAARILGLDRKTLYRKLQRYAGRTQG